MNPEEFPRYTDLERAIFRLPILPGWEAVARGAINTLAVRGMIIIKEHDARVQKNNHEANIGTTRKELKSFVERAIDLADKIRSNKVHNRAREQLTKQALSFHQPALTALTNVLDRHQFEFDLRVFSRLRCGGSVTEDELRTLATLGQEAIQSLGQTTTRGEAEEQFLEQYPEIRRIRTGGDQIKFHDGRTPDRTTRTVAGELAQHYYALTGNAPTRISHPNRKRTIAFAGSVRKKTKPPGPGGSFFELVKEIFEILGIKAEPDEAAKRAIERWKKSNPSHHT